MSLSIRQRCQKVAECIQTKRSQGLQAIAQATGLTISSVYRHQQAIARRNHYPESWWWETLVGSQWLKVLVLGVVYYFGIKHGIGAEGLAEFFEAVHLNHHVGTSASSLRKLKQQMRDAIEAYEAAQSEHCQPREGHGICVGGDETFFGLPILVLVELASGYILTEVECENRTYDTWSTQIQQWWTQPGWQCHFMVSDGAPALIKLALSGLTCVSVADLFHALRALAQPIGSAIGRQVSQFNKKAQTLQKQYAQAPNEVKRQEFKQSLEAWWRWVNEALLLQTDDLEVQQWVLTVLLPWTYWLQQADKTRHPDLKREYQEAANRGYEQLAAHAITQQMGVKQGQQWMDWAQWMSAKYQRTSSAVEGRNGYLSGLHHAGRGLSAQTLKVLTIIHNFDLKRADGTTAAQRLFDYRFPDLFDWVVDYLGELPVARRSSKAQQVNPLPLGLFSA